MHVSTSRLLFSIAVLTASLSAQTTATFPATATAYGTPCPATLSASDTIVGTKHRLDFSIQAAIPGKPVALFFGDKSVAVPLPGGCLLVANPLVGINLMADMAGTAVFSLSLPGALVGNLFAQAIPYDPLTGIMRASNGLALGFRGQLLIRAVTPLSAGPGDLIKIDGTGFDPTPVNNAVLFAGESAGGSVIAATATQLVVRVGLVPILARGDVSVMVGRGATLPAKQFSFGGVTGNLVSGRTFVGTHSADAGVLFQLNRTSANCLPAYTTPLLSGGQTVHIPLPPMSTSQLMEMVSCDAVGPGTVHRPRYFTFGLVASGFSSEDDAALWIAGYLNQELPQYAATARGNVVSFTLSSAPILRAMGAAAAQ